MTSVTLAKTNTSIPISENVRNMEDGCAYRYGTVCYVHQYQQYCRYRSMQSTEHTCTAMRRITTFRSTTDRIYHGDPIRLYYYIMLRYIILYIILYYITLYYIILCYVMLCYVMLCYVTLCYMLS